MGSRSGMESRGVEDGQEPEKTPPHLPAETTPPSPTSTTIPSHLHPHPPLPSPSVRTLGRWIRGEVRKLYETSKKIRPGFSARVKKDLFNRFREYKDLLDVESCIAHYVDQM